MNASVRLGLYAALAAVLGSCALLPLYADATWLVPVVTAVAVVAGATALARLAHVPAVLTAFVPYVALLLFVTAVFAPKVAIAGFVPGPGAFAQLRAIMDGGFDDMARMAAPVSRTIGLDLITTTGVGILAIVIDVFAVGLRRPALAGLPLLALFAVPAAVLSSGVGWIPFTFSAAGFVTLLIADGRDRIIRWGRPVRAAGSTTSPLADASGDTGGAARASAQLSQLGRRAGVVAIGVAIVVPLAIPGLHSGWFGRHTTHNGNLPGNIGHDGVGIDPMVSLKRDLTLSTPIDLFSYTTTDPRPDYLRFLTLDTFDGETWLPTLTDPDRLKKASNGIPPDVRSNDSTAYITKVRIDNLVESWLPVPINTAGLSGIGDQWRYDPNNESVVTTRGSTRGESYTTTSTRVDPSLDALEASREDPGNRDLAVYLKLPRDLPAAIHDEAEQVTARATTPYDQAVALQQYFHDNFIYDLSVKSGNSDNDLLAFLHDRRGYCEQFAATMALMARSLGIPARVAVGFTPGTQNADGRYVVTTFDAHSWPELYFPGVGWLRFEPTPRGDGQAYAADYAPGPAGQGGGNGQVPVPTTAPGTSATTPATGATSENGSTSSGTGGAVTMHVPAPLLGVLVIALLIVVPGPLVRSLRRRRRWRQPTGGAHLAHVAWAEISDVMRDLRIEWHGYDDTPRQAAARLISTNRLHWDPPAEAALLRLAKAEELARYARRSPAEPKAIRADVDLLTKSLFNTVLRWRRLRARMFPASAYATITQWLVAKWDRLAEGAAGLADVSRRRIRDRRTGAATGLPADR